MKCAVLLVLLAVGCGGSARTASTDLGVADLSAGEPFDLAPSADLFVGRYSCEKTLDQYCAGVGGCIRRLSDAIKPDAGCDILGSVAESCGNYVYVTVYYVLYNDGGPLIGEIMVYDSASGQLVAVLNGGPAGKSECLGGAALFVDPEVASCPGLPTDPNNPSDGGAPVQICPAPYGNPPCAGGPAARGGTRRPDCA